MRICPRTGSASRRRAAPSAHGLLCVRSEDLAHRQLGRGFVLCDAEAGQPVYVTHMAGAPPALVDAVLGYDPEREALVVAEDATEDDTIVVIRVHIDVVH